jgi:hypothetical protein
VRNGWGSEEGFVWRRSGSAMIGRRRERAARRLDREGEA